MMLAIYLSAYVVLEVIIKFDEVNHIHVQK